MMTTMGCMRAYLSRVIFAGLLGGIALGGATFLGVSLAFAGETTSPITSETSATEDTGPNATYDETQPGADDPRVKEGFAAYKAGDFKQAYNIWLPLAEAGNAEAQFRVGRLYDFEEIEDVDINAAISWYKYAAAQRHIGAIYNLGLFFDYDKRIPRNIENARAYYQDGANLCDGASQYRLGALILRMPRADRDNTEGHKWLEIAVVFGQERAGKASKKLVGLISTPIEYEAGKKKAQEWLQNHPCGKTKKY